MYPSLDWHVLVACKVTCHTCKQAAWSHYSLFPVTNRDINVAAGLSQIAPLSLCLQDTTRYFLQTCFSPVVDFHIKLTASTGQCNVLRMDGRCHPSLRPHPDEMWSARVKFTFLCASSLFLFAAWPCFSSLGFSGNTMHKSRTKAACQHAVPDRCNDCRVEKPTRVRPWGSSVHCTVHMCVCVCVFLICTTSASCAHFQQR